MKCKYYLTFLFFSIVGIYLFATTPQPLEAENTSARKIPIETVLDMINQEHKVVRAVYTKKIVKPTNVLDCSLMSAGKIKTLTLVHCPLNSCV